MLCLPSGFLPVIYSVFVQPVLAISVIINILFPGCSHCQNTKPDFEEAAEIFKDDPIKMLAAVDCSMDSG